MRIARVFLSLLLLIAASPIPGRGQVCSGFASFTGAPFRLSAGAAFNSDATGFGASFSGGKDFFGSFGLGATSYDDLDASSFDLSFGGGYDFAIDQQRRAFLCPDAAVVISLGPNDIAGTGVDLRTVAFAFGFSIGGIAAQSPQFAVLPAGGLSFARATVTAEGFGTSASASDTYGIFSAGIGLLIQNVFTIRPGVAVPFGLENAEASFALTFALSFGKRATGST